jgi:hypothetical protein
MYWISLAQDKVHLCYLAKKKKAIETCGLIQVRSIMTTCVTVTYSSKTPFSFFFNLTSSTDL